MGRTLDPAIEAEIPGLVSEDGTWVSRRLFFDPDLYEIEKHRVFGRSWLMVGHESQIPNPGDFFLSFMGEQSVIVVRDNEGADSRPPQHLPAPRHARLQGRSRQRADLLLRLSRLELRPGWQLSWGSPTSGRPIQRTSTSRTSVSSRCPGSRPTAA